MTAYLPQKIGFYSISKAARELCRLLNHFAPIIKYYFPDSTALNAAVVAAQAACSALEEQIAEQRKITYPP